MEQPDQADKAQTNVSIPQEKETHSSPSPPPQQEQDQEASLPNQLRPILSHSDSTRPTPISNNSQHQPQRYYPPTIPTHYQHQQQQQPPYQRHHQASYSFQQISSYDYYNPPPPLLPHYPRSPAQQASQENKVDDDDCGSQDEDEDLMSHDGGGESRRESGYDSTTTRRTSGSSTASNLTAHQPQQFYAPFRSFQNTVSSGAGGGPNYYTYENPAPWSYSPSSLYNPYFPTQSVPPYSNFEAASQSGSRTIYSKLGSPSISPTTPASNSQLPHITQRGYLPPLPPGSSSAVPLRQPDQVPPPPPPPHASPSVPRSQSVGDSQQVHVDPAQSPSSAPEPIIRKRRAKPQNSYDIPAITGINPFICKLRYMLQNSQEFSDLICWSEQDGESILVDFGNPLLVDDLLPRVFNHSNPQAFRSQFTKYGFVALTGQSLEFALNGPQEEQQEQRPSTSFPAYASPSNPTPAPPPAPSSSSIDVGLVHQHDFSSSASASSTTFIIPNSHQQQQSQQQQQPIEGDSEDEDEEELENGERQVEEEEEEEEGEPVTPKVFRSSSKGWKGFRHRHTREDFESVLQSEKKNQLKKHGQKLSTTATGGEAKLPQGAAMEEEDDEEEEEEEEEEDCNWFSLETMNDLKILKRVKPVGAKSRASGQAPAGKGRKKRLNEEDDEDEEDQEGGARKKASNMINSVAGVASGSGSGTRMIGGVEVPKATQEKYS
ncbi:hypothetical protein JCM3765_005961 [Sporobolomyces pararoseus]